jgi:hypothetical protein
MAGIFCLGSLTSKLLADYYAKSSNKSLLNLHINPEILHQVDLIVPSVFSSSLPPYLQG